MGIGMIFGAIEAAAGIVTLNPAMIVDGARRSATSYLIGEALEPIKEVVGEGVSDLIDSVSS